MRAAVRFCRPEVYEGTREDSKNAECVLSSETLILNISENACSRAFLTSRSVRRYSRGRQKSAGIVFYFQKPSLKYFRECVQPCVFDVPKCTKVLERAAKKCGDCVLFSETLILNISENACSRAFLSSRSVRRYSRGRQKSAGCALSEIFTEFTELIDISRSRVKIMLEVAVCGVKQRFGNLALGPEL